MRFEPNSIAVLATSILLMSCAAGGGADPSTDDENSGDGDTGAVGDGDSSLSESGGSTAGDGDTGTGGGDAGTGGTGTGGAAAGTGGASNSGGTSGVSCTPGVGVEDVGSGSFLDKVTCLVWQKTDTHAGTITNRGALSHCATLNQDGQSWRLPTAQELRTYPSLPDSGNAYLAGPTYIPSSSTDDATG